MATSKRSTAPSTPQVEDNIPRYIRSLNDWAAKRGFVVDVEKRDPDPGETWDRARKYFYMIWTGPIRLIRDSGYFPRCYRFPGCGSGTFRFSKNRRGTVKKNSRGWVVAMNAGEVPQRIEQRGDVEVLHFDGGSLAYHGSGEALIAAGIQADNLPTGKRDVKHTHYSREYLEPAWTARRLLDGSFLIDIEADAHFQERKQEYEKRIPNRTCADTPSIDDRRGDDVVARLDRLVDQAISDYNRGKDHRKIALSPLVKRHAHSWCVDFFGPSAGLISAGVALGQWFRGDFECKEVKIAHRRIELFRGGSEFGPIELSVRYTERERARIR